MLALFIVTGCRQTLTTDEEKKRVGGRRQSLIQHLSTIHADSRLPPGHPDQTHVAFKTLVVAVCAGLLLSVVLGLALAARVVKEKRPAAGTLVLGVAVPALILWLGR